MMLQGYVRQGRRKLGKWLLNSTVQLYARAAAYVLAGFGLSAAGLFHHCMPIAMGLVWGCSGTSAALAAAGKKRPGILATDGTVQSGLYQRECAALGMEAVVPDEATQKLVMSIIYDEIKQGEQGSREKFAQIDRALRNAGCDCAILACTELSVFAAYHSLPAFYLDAMMVLAEESVKRCGYPLRMI